MVYGLWFMGIKETIHHHNNREEAIHHHNNREEAIHHRPFSKDK
jgi:hypothetical protein